MYQLKAQQRQTGAHSTRGGATILRVGGTNITASEASRKFFGLVPPHMPFWGYNSYKERHTESLSDSVAVVLVQF